MSSSQNDQNKPETALWIQRTTPLDCLMIACCASAITDFIFVGGMINGIVGLGGWLLWERIVKKDVASGKRDK